MSWSEVYKVNSDIQGEPLNFLNYLNDLKLNELDSYVLYDGNIRIWEELYLNSLYLFSNRGIREVVYAAFSETDIDNLFDKSTKLGEQLNAFYRTDIFSLGNADNVVKGMTIEYYNSLEEKFKAGYDRYVTREQEKSSIGMWFNSTFNLNNTDLESLTTIEEILANTEATNAILNNSNAIVALTMCKSSMDAVVVSSIAMDLLGQYILRITAEPIVIKAILKNNVIRDAIINSDEAMTQIATNENSVMEILKDVEAVKTLIANSNSINKILTNNEVSGVIMPKIINSKGILVTVFNYTNNIKTNVDASKEQCNTNMYKEDVFPFLKEISENYKKIDDKIQVIKENNSNFAYIADLIMDNANMANALVNVSMFIDAILTSTPTLNVIVNNTNMMKTISGNLNAINRMIKNSTALNMCISSGTAMAQISANATAINAIIGYSTAFIAIMNNSNAFNSIANSTNAMTIIMNSTSAISQVMNNSNAMNVFMKNSNAMNIITKTPVALNMMLKSSNARTSLATSPYLQAYYNNIETTVTNSTYFTKGTATYIDSGNRISNASGAMITSNDPDQCLYMSLLIGSWSNGTSTTGNIAHLQNKVIVRTITTTIGQISSGRGESARYVCVGGCAFTETGDSGTWGYMVYAK
ncbi:phage tail protein [Clostridioides sp. GD02404]|uniref:phage tail protein n=1 Tax=Clostridioides sp. GD02404 TaxID=3054354 RepID=UPI00389F3CB1